jgi:hypothetical protein
MQSSSFLPTTYQPQQQLPPHFNHQSIVVNQQPLYQQQQNVFDQHLYPQQQPQIPPLISSPTLVINSSSLNANIYSPQQWKLQDFEMLRTIVTVSYGRVRLCRNRVNGNYYAIKILKKVKIIQQSQVEHVNNERNIQYVLDHPFIVKLHRTFQDEQNLYIIMDYIRGGELFTHLREVQVFPNDVCVYYY